MALNDFETARKSGAPVELYRILYGETAALTYTDGEAPITYNGEVYEPHPGLERSKIESSGKLQSPEMKIVVPITSPIAELFRIYPPGRVVSIVIRQGHVTDASTPSAWATGENFPVSWSGRVLEGRRDDLRCTLTCELISASMRRPGLRQHYQWTCSLPLYGARCAANQAAATTVGTVASISGNRVSLQAGWEKVGRTGPDYIGGMIRWTGTLGSEFRSILRVEGNTLVLDGPPIDLAVAAPVDVMLGCPHTLDGCQTVHANAVNFGGHPFIPSGTNPIGKNNHTHEGDL